MTDFKPIKVFEKKYLLALAFIATVTFLSFSISIIYINTNNEYGSLINMSGMQRMLSQRSVYLLNEYIRTNDRNVKEKLNITLDLFVINHLKIKEGKWKEGRLFELSEEAKSFYKDSNLDTRIKLFQSEITDSIRKKELSSILSAEFIDDLLSSLNSAVQIFEDENTIVINNFKMIQLLLCLSIFVSLYMSYSLIFKPVEKMMDTSVKEILYSQQKEREAFDVKNRFLKMISHEMNTPLNGIVGYAELISSEVLGRKGKEYVVNLQKNVEILSNTIEDILDYSNFSIQDLVHNSTTFDLKELIEKTLSIYIPLFKEKGISVEKEIDISEVMITSGSRRIRQVLSILLHNALAYTNEGKVSIKVNQKILDDKKIETQISILDTGIGIHDKNFSKMFNPFSQISENPQAEVGGKGLGLHFSQKICNSLGGDLWFTSKEGEGSTFIFTFIANKYKDLNKFEKEDFSQIKALIVDDNRTNILVAKRFLEKIGVQSEGVLNGKEAIELLKHNPKIDIILMDLDMPIMDGFEATENIRKIISSDPWIIAFTAASLDNTFEKCEKVGMNDFLSKPLKMNDLKIALRKYTSSINKKAA